METTAKHELTLTRLNIRESISILLFKLIALDFIAATFTIIYFSLVSFSPSASFTEQVLTYRALFFVLLGLLKIGFTIYIVLLWINEYYELTVNEVTHKSGIIRKYKKDYQFKDVRTIKVSQGLLGKIFNYGTIEMDDERRNKRVELYLIHNPHRYIRLMEKLIPNAHEEKRTIEPHFFGEESNGYLSDEN